MKSRNTTESDFIFLDPPYDTEFSTYDQNEFTQNDQKRLAKFLTSETNCKWQLVIKNTDFIHGLYEKDGINIQYFDKSYNVSFMNRNDKKTEHLLITNY
jgi:DNA adenine methylase